MQTISILGCGWLGLPLGAFLVTQGFKVKGSTTSPEKLSLIQEKGIEPFLIKVGEHLEGEKTMEFFQSDTLVLNIPPRRRIPNIEHLYPLQIQAIYEAAKAGSIQKLLFVGSTGIYGNVNRMVTEEDIPVPDKASGRALLKCEQFLQQQTDIAVTFLRLAGLVGGDRKAGRFLAGKQNLSNGKAPINLIHQEDCIRIIHEIIQQEKWGATFNAAADEHPEKAVFYTAQTLKMGLEPPQFLEEENATFKIISNAKLKQELSYTFQFPDPIHF